MTNLPVDAPAPDEIEVSVFGKGFGEAIAVHVGGHRWIAIDSLSIGQISVTHHYLSGLGFDPKDHLDVVIATHWHDDHIRGLAQLFESAAAAEMIVPLAMLKTEFIKFAAAFSGQSSTKFSSGVEEFGKILEIAAARHKPNTAYPLRMAYNGYVGYRKPSGSLPHGQQVSLEALSPSNFDVAAFLHRIGQVNPEAKLLQRAPLYRPNDVSAAYWLQIGNDAVLFGADVENSSGVNSGWNAILNAPVQPIGKASLLKIPHHGGVSGHNDKMWSQFLTEGSIGTLTPWTKGGNRLPSGADIARLITATAESYSTGPSANGKTATQPFSVAKALSKDKVSLQRVANKIGQVRHRGKVLDGKIAWTTTLFGEACNLAAMAK